MIATALLFSGRPNPHWRIDPATATRLAPLLAALKPSDDNTGSSPPGLGYAGIELQFVGERGERILTFRRGLATGATGSYIDADCAIEDLLIQSARGRLSAADFAALVACR